MLKTDNVVKKQNLYWLSQKTNFVDKNWSYGLYQVFIRYS